MVACRAVGQGNELNDSIQFLAVTGEQSAGMVFGVVGMSPEEKNAWRRGHFDLLWFSLAAFE